MNFNIAYKNNFEKSLPSTTFILHSVYNTMQ